MGMRPRDQMLSNIRQLACQHFIKNQPERIQIRSAVDAPVHPAGLLGGHIGGVQLRLVRKPLVDHLHLERAGLHLNRLRAQSGQDQILRMQRLQLLRNLNCHAYDIGQVKLYIVQVVS
ncbi:hypothetical protein M5X19_09040 [Paenibacillus alginolyticus]|uniref:Uncharacterized protein n=1 Tax=Paenibacillus alginolyticus TaxID=59839 RepID=A0ABT4GA79_9BACL|nr:hypothetical protein [Paenibacillus alginolyticus]MCY9693039.1 hypothetical protein [Paenibacillus alginolyticus]